MKIYTKTISQNFDNLAKTDANTKSFYLDELLKHYKSIREKVEVEDKLKAKFEKMVVRNKKIKLGLY